MFCDRCDRSLVAGEVIMISHLKGSSLANPYLLKFKNRSIRKKKVIMFKVYNKDTKTALSFLSFYWWNRATITESLFVHQDVSLQSCVYCSDTLITGCWLVIYS